MALAPLNLAGPLLPTWVTITTPLPVATPENIISPLLPPLLNPIVNLPTLADVAPIGIAISPSETAPSSVATSTLPTDVVQALLGILGLPGAAPTVPLVAPAGPSSTEQATSTPLPISSATPASSGEGMRLYADNGVPPGPSSKPITTSIAPGRSLTGSLSTVNAPPRVTTSTSSGGGFGIYDYSPSTSSSPVSPPRATPSARPFGIYDIDSSSAVPSTCQCAADAKPGLYCGYCSQILTCDAGECSGNAYGCSAQGCAAFGMLESCYKASASTQPQKLCPFFDQQVIIGA